MSESIKVVNGQLKYHVDSTCKNKYSELNPGQWFKILREHYSDMPEAQAHAISYNLFLNYELMNVSENGDALMRKPDGYRFIVIRKNGKCV